MSQYKVKFLLKGGSLLYAMSGLEAIKATFDNRKLAYNPHLHLFSDAFATDVERKKQWKSFLKKIQ